MGGSYDSGFCPYGNVGADTSVHITYEHLCARQIYSSLMWPNVRENRTRRTARPSGKVMMASAFTVVDAHTVMNVMRECAPGVMLCVPSFANSFVCGMHFHYTLHECVHEQGERTAEC